MARMNKTCVENLHKCGVGRKTLGREMMILALGCLTVVCGVFAMHWADGAISF